MNEIFQNSNKTIPYGRQDITDEDIEEVVKILKSDFLTQGPTVPLFEEIVSTYSGSNHAIAVNSGTSALHIASLALGIGPGDIVWTSPNTFVASANCVLYCGAKIDFVDIDKRTFNLCPEKLELKLIEAKKKQELPKVVIPVHIGGQSCDMKAIHRLSKKYGFRIIEDASHAIGALYDGKKVGNCLYSDFTIFSFHPVKIITSGEGGMALTNDKELARKARLFSSHGITSNTDEMDVKPDNEIWNYQQIELGFNYRMTDIHAALGISQMTRIDKFLSKRRELAKRYDEMLDDLPVIVPFQAENCLSSYHLYLLKVNSEIQKKVYQSLTSDGINVNLHYIPVYRQPYFMQFGFRQGYCKNAEEYFKSVLTIPLYPGLSFDDQDRVIESISKSI
ncbi:UDP-4-amino-4,6-dideoxy-N-acetyl-beta-L-altrosamine transaminase [Gammaproteobacteria bacterium]|nr:UDP-4-amino-4,6-dideoxy-N-acetyl-beta-L-altrosamine transaminase [Gammaproteobacteria bacterium]